MEWRGPEGRRHSILADAVLAHKTLPGQFAVCALCCLVRSWPLTVQDASYVTSVGAVCFGGKGFVIF